MLSVEDMEEGKVYASTSMGSKGLLFTKLNGTVLVFNNNYVSTTYSHTNDLYLAPKEMAITISN
jgi:hypothetical protein